MSYVNTLPEAEGYHWCRFNGNKPFVLLFFETRHGDGPMKAMMPGRTEFRLVVDLLDLGMEWHPERIVPPGEATPEVKE